jgi:broad specificity phosphatase PhoE
MMQITVARHGKTEESEKGIIMGHLDPLLSDKGIAEANQLKNDLKRINFDIVYSSDLNRALMTARIVIELRSNVEIVKTKLLREFDFGAFTGKHKDEVNWGDFPKDGETFEQIHKRAIDFIEILRIQNHKKILVLTHNGFTKALLCVALKKTSGQIDNLPNIATGSYFHLEFNGDKVNISGLNQFDESN